MADGSATTPNTATSSDTASTTKTSNTEFQVRLTARSWQKPIYDTNGRITGYTRYNRGDTLTVDQTTFDTLNAFKASFEKVES